MKSLLIFLKATRVVTIDFSTADANTHIKGFRKPLETLCGTASPERVLIS
jgi:hypothetical protein